MARLFFALKPEAGAAEALAERARRIAGRLGGRPVAGANLHLTLAFLGEVGAGRLGSLRQAAEETRGRAFEVRLDRIGGFRHAGIVWAGCRKVPAELLALQAELENGLRAAGFPVDSRPFAPHLTLVRGAREPVTPMQAEAIAWRADAFALMESVRGEGTYRDLAVWPLEREKT